MSRGELHQLRKRAKRFRYTLEFFSELYGKPSRWVLRRLKTLQNKLGAFIDASQAIDTMQALLESEALDDQTRQLVNDLIEMHSEGRARALEELREIRRALSRPWRKLRRRMGEVSDAFESQRARERSVQQKRKRSGGEPLVAASAH